MTRAPWAGALLAATLAVVAGCSAGGAGGASPDEDTEAATAPPGAVSIAGGTPDLTAPEVVAAGLELPWGLAFLPDGDALVGERGSGRVLRLQADGGEPELVREIPGVVEEIEGGLLGLAVSPSFADDGLVYAYLTTADDARVVRFVLDGDDPVEVVLDGLTRGPGHSGGRIAFGPDGMLYLAVGDGTFGERAQDPESPNGKILRITPDGEPAPGNPVPGSPVWSLGHRNPQGLAWDPDGRLFAVELGEDAADEVNVIETGGNYGWPEVEGVAGPGDARYIAPVLTWDVAEASPSGVAIAGDTMYVAALRGERLWVVPLADGVPGDPVAHLEGDLGRLRTVAIAPDGALWLTTSNHQRSGDPDPDDDRVLRFPASG